VKFKVVAMFCAAWFAAGAASAQDAGGESTFTITKVSVDGNKYFKDDRIKDLLRIEKGQQYKYLFDYMLEKGIAAVKKAYYAEGFAAVKIRWAFRDVKRGKRKLQLHVDEGPRAKITDILLEGVGRERYLEVRENLGVEVGSPLSAGLLNEAAFKVGRYYGERGYVRVSVELQIDRDTGVVTFTVDEGRVYHVGEILVAGNEKTRPKIVTREIDYKIKPDRLWRASKIDESRANIYRTGLYRDLKVEPADSQRSPDLVDILVIVREDKFKWYKLEPGYESPDRASFTVGWGHNNVFGNNQRLSTELSAAYGFLAEDSKFGAEVTYIEPWLFGYRYKGTSTLYYKRERREDLRIWQVGLEPRVTREITDHLEVTGGFNLKRTKTTFEAEGESPFAVWPAEEGGGGRYIALGGLQNIASIIFSSTYDTRDDVFNALEGIYLFGSEETAGGFIAGSDFWRVIGDGRRYVRVGRAAAVAGHLRGGYVRAYAETKDIPYVEKFFSGGAFSVRGYREQDLGPQTDDGYALGGNLLLTANVELRFQIPFTAGRRVPGIGLNLGNLWAGLFFDGGNVWSDWDETSKLGLVYGAGLGLRYNTPVGPIRFDYGQPVLEPAGQAPGHFYLAFGHIF
jgi:outer membrane protein insertion porin family